MCKSAAPSQNNYQKIYKFVIKRANLIIHTTMLTSSAHKALIYRFVSQNMLHHLSHAHMKHLSIIANQISIDFDNVLNGAQPDLVVIDLVSNADFADGYQ